MTVTPARSPATAGVSPARGMPEVPGVRHRFVDAGGVRFHVAEAGPGDGESRGRDPVLLLHGFPQHWYAWRHVIGLLAPEYRLICPDLRGFGWSDAPARGYDLATGARDVLNLMDALGVARATLIGHHGGGVLGFRACLAAPERFTGFLALNCVHPWPVRRRLLVHAWRNWYTALLEYPGIGRRVLAHWPGFAAFLLRYGAADAAVWEPGETEEFAAALRPPARARAGEQVHWQFVCHDIPALVMGRYPRTRLEVPTLILAGAADPVTPPAMLAGHSQVGDLAVEVVPGAGQFLPAERPDLVVAAVRRLATSAPGGGDNRGRRVDPRRQGDQDLSR
ncbi:MAG TPA: alpha/beta hydrolase [Streptosporangiaceae bacterium]|nr:alpha/beta hydrolase [Streptosporangiaceae bacterium]